MTGIGIEFYKEARETVDRITPNNILKFIDEYYPDEKPDMVKNFMNEVAKEFEKLWYNIQQKEYKVIHTSGKYWKEDGRSNWLTDNNCKIFTIDSDVITVCALSAVSDKYFDDMIKIVVGSPYIKYVVECHNNGDYKLATDNNGLVLTFPIYFDIINKDSRYETIQIDYIGGFDDRSFMTAINQMDGTFDYSLYNESEQAKKNISFDYNDRILNILKQYEKSVADIVDELPYDRDVKTQLHKYIWSLMYYQISN